MTDDSAYLNSFDQTANVLLLTGLTEDHHDNTSMSLPQLEGHNQAPSSPAFASDQSTTIVPPLSAPPSTFNSDRSNTTEPSSTPMPPKIAESQTQKPIDGPPPRYEISVDILKAVKLRPMIERLLKMAKANKLKPIVNDPPQGFEITVEILKAVKLRPMKERLLKMVESNKLLPTYYGDESQLSTPRQATSGIFFSILNVLFLYFIIFNYSSPTFNTFTSFDLSQIVYSTVLFFSFVFNYLIYMSFP